MATRHSIAALSAGALAIEVSSCERSARSAIAIAIGGELRHDFGDTQKGVITQGGIA